MQEYRNVLQKYAVFSGRARRREYWMFVLVNIIISIIFALIGSVINSEFLGNIYALAMIVPALAVGVRRLHDTGRSGWWLLIGLVPLVGAIVLIVFAVQDSQPGDNEYGPNPKGITAAPQPQNQTPPTPPSTPTPPPVQQ